jgi:hypothetical protein
MLDVTSPDAIAAAAQQLLAAIAASLGVDPSSLELGAPVYTPNDSTVAKAAGRRRALPQAAAGAEPLPRSVRLRAGERAGWVSIPFRVVVGTKAGPATDSLATSVASTIQTSLGDPAGTLAKSLQSAGLGTAMALEAPTATVKASIVVPVSQAAAAPAAATALQNALGPSGAVAAALLSTTSAAAPASPGTGGSGNSSAGSLSSGGAGGGAGGGRQQQSVLETEPIKVVLPPPSPPPLPPFPPSPPRPSPPPPSPAPPLPPLAPLQMGGERLRRPPSRSA